MSRDTPREGTCNCAVEGVSCNMHPDTLEERFEENFGENSHYFKHGCEYRDTPEDRKQVLTFIQQEIKKEREGILDGIPCEEIKVQDSKVGGGTDFFANGYNRHVQETIDYINSERTN